MGESAGLKGEMCDLIKAFVISRVGMQGSVRVYFVIARLSVTSHDAAQTRRALAIITFVLRQTIPTVDTPSSFAHGDSAIDRISFYKTAFTAYSTIIGSIGVVQRADLSAVGLHLFSDLLKDETPGMDLAGPILPSLKMLVDQALSGQVQVPGVSATSEDIVRGLLSACIASVDDMR